MIMQRMFTEVLLGLFIFYSFITTIYIIHLKTCSCRFCINRVVCLMGFVYGLFLRFYAFISYKLSKKNVVTKQVVEPFIDSDAL